MKYNMIEKTKLPVIRATDFLTMPVITGGRVQITTNEQEIKECCRISEQLFSSRICLIPENTEAFDNLGLLGIIENIVFRPNPIDNETEAVINISLQSRLTYEDIKDNLVDNTNIIYQTAECTIYLDDNIDLDAQDMEVFKYIRKQVTRYINQAFTDAKAIAHYNSNNTKKSQFCDLVMSSISIVQVDIIQFLKELDFSKRLMLLATALDQAEQFVQIDFNIEEAVHKELDKEQREYYLRKKIKAIQEDLGDIDKASSDADVLREKILALGMPEEAEKQALKELKRYTSTISASPESTIIRTYLDTLIALPWQAKTEDNTDIDAVKAKLDETHSGLDKPKERILDYLAVKLYSQKTPQTILCLAGPPGTGKTTIAKSIAEALGRKFVKQSLGGVKDEAEIRGHRRTYLGALPGRIINGIKEAKVKNPVFLLDEIDKLGADYKGDPSASLLEVLDPAQNAHFMDHYLELEFDLSEVMFICTANDLSAIPGPLADRMEIIELSSYTGLEKFKIAREHAINKSLEKNGLESEKFEITDEALNELIRYYTREAGARQLERCLDTVVRRSIKKIMSENLDKVVVDQALLKEMLGKKKYDYDIVEKEDLVGVVNGLAYTEYGGDVLQIEAVANMPKEDTASGNYTITGNLGDVMKESAEAAYNWIKAHRPLLDLSNSQFNSELHIHCPAGATPKDGPSAGVTFVTAMLSAMSNTPVKHNIGMTGEITLRGKILPIGGLKEKSIAAYTQGLDTIYIPKENERDIEDLPEEIKANLKIIPVDHIEELIPQVFTKNILEGEIYGQA